MECLYNQKDKMEECPNCGTKECIVVWQTFKFEDDKD